jgi:hypothetical protein
MGRKMEAFFCAGHEPANQACVTPHVWLSRTDKLDVPDQMVFDLDPSGDSFRSIAYRSLQRRDLRDRLTLLALELRVPKPDDINRAGGLIAALLEQ